MDKETMTGTNEDMTEIKENVAGSSDTAVQTQEAAAEASEAAAKIDTDAAETGEAVSGITEGETESIAAASKTEEHSTEETDTKAAADAAEPAESAKPAREHRQRFGFLRGVAAGVLLSAVAFTLYRGYIYFPVGRSGEILIELPYYQALHGSSETGHIDNVEINRKLTEISDLLKNNYLYDENPQLISDGIFSGLAYGLSDEDDYAAYYSASSYDSKKKDFKGSYVGIGVTVSKDEETGGVWVAEVAEGGPAESAGIEEGDIIMEADGNDLTVLELEDCIALITGEEGTEVRLKLLREGESLEITVTRETVKDITVRYEVIPGTNIGYLSISGFKTSTEQDFYEAMDDLGQDKQVDGIVIDLRNNSGGDMNVALRMVDSILEDDLGENGSPTLLLSNEDKNGEIENYYSEDGVYDNTPVNILVNEHSASASEIFAGVLKYYGRDVIGTRTFGKGIVQQVFGLSDDSAIKFTTDYYLLPDGSRIHGIGIEPTIEVEFEDYDAAEADTVNYSDTKLKPDFKKDTQLRKAIEAMQEQLYS